jgi:hypothetical protein
MPVLSTMATSSATTSTAGTEIATYLSVTLAEARNRGSAVNIRT